VLALGALLEMGAFGLFHQQLTDIIWILLVMQLIMVLVFGIRFSINLWRIRPARALKQSDGFNDQR
jgi:hypothetical protein